MLEDIFQHSQKSDQGFLILFIDGSGYGVWAVYGSYPVEWTFSQSIDVKAVFKIDVFKRFVKIFFQMVAV